MSAVADAPALVPVTTPDTTIENKTRLDRFKVVYAKEYKTLDEDLKKRVDLIRCKEYGPKLYRVMNRNIILRKTSKTKNGKSTFIIVGSISDGVFIPEIDIFDFFFAEEKGIGMMNLLMIRSPPLPEEEVKRS
jgi:hypothetical protein